MANNSGLKPLHIFLITLALCILALGLWWTFSFQSKQEQMTRLKADIEAAEATVAQYRQAEAALPTLRDEVDVLEKERAEFVAALPKTTEMSNILAEMRRTAATSGVTIPNITVGGGDNNNLPGGLRPITLTLNMQGTYSENFQALRRLETLNRFSTIDGLQLQAGEATSNNPDLNGTLGVTVYTFDPTMAAMPVEGETEGGAAAAPAAPAAPATPQGDTP